MIRVLLAEPRPSYLDGRPVPPRNDRPSHDSYFHRRQKRRKLKADPRCRLCGSVSYVVAHHLVPRRLGGGDVADNLIPLCGAEACGCHERVEAGDHEALALLEGRLTDAERAYRAKHGYA